MLKRNSSDVFVSGCNLQLRRILSWEDQFEIYIAAQMWLVRNASRKQLSILKSLSARYRMNDAGDIKLPVVPESSGRDYSVFIDIMFIASDFSSWTSFFVLLFYNVIHNGYCSSVTLWTVQRSLFRWRHSLWL